MDAQALELMVGAGWLCVLLVALAVAMHLRRGIDDHAASVERSVVKQTATLEAALRRPREPAPAPLRRTIAGLIPPASGSEEP